jgi:splicing factor U2AF subunit
VPRPAPCLPHPPAQILEDLRTEASKWGGVVGLCAPLPPVTVAAHEPARVYIKYTLVTEAEKCRSMMEGRKFDENTVRALFVTEGEYLQAQAGVWVPKPGLLMPGAGAAVPGLGALPGVAGLVPGLGTAMPAAAGVPGLSLPPGFALPAGLALPGVPR